MNRNPNPDLHINGVATAPGGHYERVQIEGVGKVEGDVQAAEFHLNGMATVRGELNAKTLNAIGKLKVEGRTSAGMTHMEGVAVIRGSLTGERLTLKGMLHVQGDCEFERLDAEGGFDIEGLLNAGFVDIRLYGRGKTREIGCDSIQVRKIARNHWKQMLQKMFGTWGPGLEAGTIEGDDIDLEHTTASMVRGNRVTLGPGCRIGRVEYRTELRKHPDAKVGEEMKTGDGDRFT
jgi:cytoskeletal protein CcmA (bactofilin family)